MCGICGRAGITISKERLLAAMEKMAHRGPDQEGSLWQSNTALGHRRLSIIDLSEGGRQPLTNEDSTIWLVFNGEIYNFNQLRTELELTHLFRSQTDSEVLIHGYEQWGIDGLLQRIRGMFAFAIWDEPRATLHIARDHLGEKPLYYSTIGGGVAFASTVPALLELLETTPEVSHTAIVDYLTYMCVPAPRTIFEGVLKLPAAHRLEFHVKKGVRVVQYWRPDFSQKAILAEDEWLAQIDTVLRDAVRERLVADVPVGAFLSGGVDSSLIVALMSEVSGQSITTVSIGFAEQRFNELPHARRVAEVYAANHYEYILRPNAADVLPALVFHYGEPFADHSALPTYYLAQIARRHVTVALTGDGGDETFAGYPTAMATALARTLQYIPGAVSGGLAATLRACKQDRYAFMRKMRWLAEVSRGAEGNYVFDPIAARTFRSWSSLIFGPALANVGHRWDSDSIYRKLWQEAGEVEWVDRALYVDMLAHLPDDLLVKTDVATMAHGLEARAPLLDRQVVELTCRIPAKLKLGRWRTKYLLKRLAERYIPNDVLYRRKQGFSLPVSDWLRGDLGGILEPILLSDMARRREYFRPEAVVRLLRDHQSGKVDHGHRLWLLLMLELWCRMFVDKDIAPSDDLSALAFQR